MADEKKSKRSGGTDVSADTVKIEGDVIGRDINEQHDSHAVIDQRGQRVAKQTNVAGDYHEGDQSINTGGGAYVGGNVSVDHGGKFVGRDDNSTTGLSGDEVAKLFASIYQKIDARPNTPPQDKEDLKSEVTDLQAEVAKGAEANETFLERRLRNIKRMAPDILEVVVSSFANPALGLATAVRKVMNKAKTEVGG
jgi:hypothetical protein